MGMGSLYHFGKTVRLDTNKKTRINVDIHPGFLQLYIITWSGILLRKSSEHPSPIHLMNTKF